MAVSGGVGDCLPDDPEEVLRHLTTKRDALGDVQSSRHSVPGGKILRGLGDRVLQGFGDFGE